VEQFLDTWLETVRPSVAASTWTPYEGLLRLHALPSIGRLRLSRLGAFNLEQLYSGRIKAGLSPTTVLQLHRVLHHALRDAVRWSLVPRNVSELVSPPRRASYEFRVLSSEQARTFLQAVKGDRLEALYVLAITTGMRELVFPNSVGRPINVCNRYDAAASGGGPRWPLRRPARPATWWSRWWSGGDRMTLSRS